MKRILLPIGLFFICSVPLFAEMDVFETIRASTQTVEPKEQISVQEVASDDFKILECAVAAEADLIVTMDQVLLRLKRFRNIIYKDINKIYQSHYTEGYYDILCCCVGV